MTNPQTRGYLVGVNSNKQFVIPEKLMDKIIETTGETALMLWIPYKKTLSIQPVSCNKVVKVTLWFDSITTTIFETKLKSLINEFKENLIFETGVLFPMTVGDQISIEYYFSDDLIFSNKLDKLEDALSVIEGVSNVEIRHLERFIGEET